MVKEEDTVTVGQDLVRLELGGEPAEKKQEEQPKPAEPEAPKPEAPKPEVKVEAPKAAEKPKAPSPPKPEPAAQKQQPAAKEQALPGNREERRVSTLSISSLLISIGSICH